MIIFIILLGILPSFAWLFFFLKEDHQPEPKKMIIKVFIAGALMTVLVLIIQFFSKIFLISSPDYLSISIFATVEEIFKFLAAYLIIKKSKFFDEPIDAIIYMIVAALGFAMIENIAVALGAPSIQEAIGAMMLRFVGATLLHALTSGIIGYYWAKKLISQNTGNCFLFPAITEGIIIASLLHTIFNYLIIISKEQILVYPTIFLIIVALFIFWDFEKIKNGQKY